MWLVATIDLAVACYFAVLYWRLTRRPAGWERAAQLAWLAGAILTWLHILLALQVVHHGSHAEAVAHTAERTRELVGLEFGGGVYFNYAFAAVWMLDAWARLAAPRWYERRPRWLAAGVAAYMLFMVVNGAIVFATGGIRWLSLLALLGLALISIARHRFPRSSAQPP